MVIAPFRTGTRAQFIERPTPTADRDADTLAQVRDRALRHLDEPLTVADLAAWAGMSPRSFARHFTATTGSTPHSWLLDQRLSKAQKLLERTDLPMSEVARTAGFGSEMTMRQHFATCLQTSPRAYRAAFAPAVLKHPRSSCSVLRAVKAPIRHRSSQSRHVRWQSLFVRSPCGDGSGVPGIVSRCAGFDLAGEILYGSGAPEGEREVQRPWMKSGPETAGEESGKVEDTEG